MKYNSLEIKRKWRSKNILMEWFTFKIIKGIVYFKTQFIAHI